MEVSFDPRLQMGENYFFGKSMKPIIVLKFLSVLREQVVGQECMLFTKMNKIG